MMKAHEFFGAFVRVIGIFEIVGGLGRFPNLISIYSQVGRVRAPMIGTTIWSLAAASAVQIVIGVILFACADWLVRLAYGRRTSEENEGEGVQPLPSLPPAVKTGLLLLVAVTLSVLYFSFDRAVRPSATDVPTTFHFILLVVIGSAALAFLFRRQWSPINGFLGWWCALVGAAVVVNSLGEVL